MLQALKSLNIKQYHSYTLMLSIALCFLLYGNTLNNDYALDDAIVITHNEFTKQGVKGIKDILSNDTFTGFFGKQKELVEGGRYRPLSLVFFALEYELFGANPFVGHLLNILWYSLLCWLVMLLFHHIFSFIGLKQAMLIAFLGGLWFLIHPIHTEAIANIKGRDEILSLLFAILSFLFVIYHQQKNAKVFLFLAGLSLFLACLAKENAISFVAITPLALWLIYKERPKAVFKTFVALLIPAITFVWLRNSVLGGFSFSEVSELMNNPFVEASGAQRIATVLYTWLVYFKLLIFPHPLTYDYYPYHIALHSFTEPVVWFAITLVLAIIASLIHAWRKNSLLAFAIVAFILSFSIVSNVFFPVGVFMNERFVFMPSLFVALILAYGLSYLLEKGHEKKQYLILLLLVGAYVVAFYPAKTIRRNKDWKNDLTLFLADVKTSNNSAKSNCSAGGKLWERGKGVSDDKQKQALFAQSEQYLNKAIAVYPEYVDAWLLLGNLRFDMYEDVEGASKAYLKVIERQPFNENAWTNVDIVLQQSSDRELQMTVYQALFKVNANSYQVNYRLGVLFGRYFNDLEQGIYYLERAVKIDASKIEAIKDLGTAYGFMGEKLKAYEQFSTAVRLDSTNRQLLINMSVASRQIGKIDEANYYISRLNELDSTPNN